VRSERSAQAPERGGEGGLLRGEVMREVDARICARRETHRGRRRLEQCAVVLRCGDDEDPEAFLDSELLRERFPD